MPPAFLLTFKPDIIREPQLTLIGELALMLVTCKLVQTERGVRVYPMHDSIPVAPVVEWLRMDSRVETVTMESQAETWA